MKPVQVLVVDDEPGMLRAVERILARRFEVTCTDDPTRALEIARRLRPDVALLDVRMPGMSGFELLERLKGQQPTLDVIIMTGSLHDMDRKIVRAIRSDAYYFIQKPFDREVLLALVDRCVAARQLEAENHRHAERMQRELTVARRYQQSLLPPGHASFGPLSLEALWVPSTELGGDFYDYQRVADGLSILVADASGHGVSAALLAGLVRAGYYASREADFDPLAVVSRVYEHLHTFGSGRFVTLFCARADPRRRRLEYVCAGHPPALLLAAGRPPCLLEPTGPIVCAGLVEQSWERATAALEPGAELLVYTDGVLDVEGVEGKYGLERLRDHAARVVDQRQAVVETIHAAVRQWAGPAAFEDDLTLLSLAAAG